MVLNEIQKQRVGSWIAEGLKLSEIQSRLASELNIRLTYIEVRLLVDDLKLIPKDLETPKPAPINTLPKVAASEKKSSESAPELEQDHPAGRVSVTVDHLARPGSVVSGQVVFSDGNRANWYLDQTGRLGLTPQKPSYRPSADDLEQFQRALEQELTKMGI